MVDKVLRRETADTNLVYLDFSLRCPKSLLNYVHVEFEDLRGLILVELGVIKADVDSRGEGLVKVAQFPEKAREIAVRCKVPGIQGNGLPD